MSFIKLHDKYIPVQVTPKDLEGEIKWKKDRQGHLHRIHNFKNNGFQVIRQFCWAYNLNFKINKSRRKWKVITLEIPEINLSFRAEDYSNPGAMLQIAFKLHRYYCRKIKTDTEKYQIYLQNVTKV